MRFLILSDLHANLPATEAVLADARLAGWDQVIVLGDLVGYGADPAAVVDIVRDLNPAYIIRGNHDKVAAGIDDASDFNVIARQAAEWTMAQLDETRAAYIRELPMGPVQLDAAIPSAICHGAPFDEDYYIFDTDDAQRAFETLPETSLLLCGHTHVQIGYRELRFGERSVVTLLDDDTIPLTRVSRTIVNPGSVGQPRDGDPRAAYGLFDVAAGAVYLRRVEYDIEEAQRRIVGAGLHRHLAERLSLGR
jgi:predicted phosphodiesterase